MLPDPYAASWSLEDQPQRLEAALAITLDWRAGAAPQLQARLDEPIQLPRPQPFSRGEAIGELGGELAGQFIQHLGGAVDQDIGLLDLSTGEDHLGVAVGFRQIAGHISTATIALPSRSSACGC